MALIRTIRGLLEESQLDKIDGYENREDEFVIWTEYRVKGDPPLPIPDELLAKIGRADKREIVRRDCHVILKRPSEVATAIVGGLSS